MLLHNHLPPHPYPNPHPHLCPGVVVLCPQEELSAAGGQGAAGHDPDGGEGGTVQTDYISMIDNKVSIALFILTRS